MKPVAQVSVVIPTFNRADCIRAAIESVIGQTIPAMEIVVVDDGSVDETAETLRPYVANRLITYIRQNNQGPSAARNTGIRNANGQYITFLDADDELRSHSIADRLAVYEKHPRLGLLCTDFRQVIFGNDNQIVSHEDHSRRRFLDDAMPYSRLIDGDVYIFHRDILHEPQILRRLIWTGTVMIPRPVLEDIGSFDETLRLAEDIDLWFRIAAKYEIGFLNTPTATYNINAKGITQNVPLYYNATISVLRGFLDPRKQLPPRYAKKLRVQIAAYYFIVGYHYYQKRDYRTAAGYFKQATQYDTHKPKYHRYAWLIRLPDAAIEGLRKYRRRMHGTPGN